jgi:Holliday junction resolvasome RuvABC endonuclease subunit
MGVIDMRKRRRRIYQAGAYFDRVTGIIESFHPDELAIEAPFLERSAVVRNWDARKVWPLRQPSSATCRSTNMSHVKSR